MLEFMPPSDLKTVLLRIYEFYDMAKKRTFTEIHAGPQPHIRIPFDWFDQENALTLKERLPVHTVIRKEKSLRQDQFDRLRLDKEAYRLELGTGSENAYDNKRVALISSLEEENSEKHLRTPRIGTQGCCGKGCNGCLIFWHDPSYARARELMKGKKIGEKLV